MEDSRECSVFSLNGISPNAHRKSAFLPIILLAVKYLYRIQVTTVVYSCVSNSTFCCCFISVFSLCLGDPALEVAALPSCWAGIQQAPVLELELLEKIGHE